MLHQILYVIEISNFGVNYFLPLIFHSCLTKYSLFNLLSKRMIRIYMSEYLQILKMNNNMYLPTSYMHIYHAKQDALHQLPTLINAENHTSSKHGSIHVVIMHVHILNKTYNVTTLVELMLGNLIQNCFGFDFTHKLNQKSSFGFHFPKKKIVLILVFKTRPNLSLVLIFSSNQNKWLISY